MTVSSNIRNVRGDMTTGKGAHGQLSEFLHGLAAGEAGVVRGAAGHKHDSAAAADGRDAVHKAPQRDALLMVGVP